MSDSVIEATVEAALHQPAPLDAPQEVMAALYTAALGPVNLMYYLNLFSRYDSIKRAGLGWNWGAALCTLPWMAFRQLWGPALIYVAVAEGLALLGLGLGRNVLHWSDTVEWVFIAVLLTASVIVPGLYGNAMVHSETRKKIQKSLAATRTVPEAYDALLKQASGWKRLIVTGVCAGAATAFAATALIVWPPGSKNLSHSQSTIAKPSTELMLDATPTVAETLAAQKTTTAPNASTPPTNVEDTAVKIAPTTTSSTPDAASAPLTSTATASAVPAAPQKTTTQAATAKKQDSTTTSSTSPAPQSSPVKPAAVATPSTSKTAGVAQKNALPTPPANATKPSTQLASITDTTAVGQAPGYYINVGLFAQASNARVTQSRLLNEGLPAFRQTVGTPSAPRIRVRVGPYASQTQAQEAAAKIKSMGLDSLIFQQTASPSKSP